ncbi:MAG: hypothetical protein JKY50_20870 [Oleispira sp.]|nr:hypothetical protein [Oleispira sp.]
MNFHEFKKVVHRGSPEVHILSNQGDLYLVQIFNDGGQSLLTQGSTTRPQVFHGLPECYERLADAGLHHAFVDQTFAHDEMINQQDYCSSHTDHRAVCF